MNGKGDKARPMAIDRKEYEDRWDMAFSKSKPLSQEEGKVFADEVKKEQSKDSYKSKIWNPKK